MWDQVGDVITGAKFYGNRLRDFGVTGPPQTPFPILNVHHPYNSVSTTVLHCDQWLTCMYGNCCITTHMLCLKFLRHVQSDVTELNWTELTWYMLVFDELANGQAVVHYSRHRLTASVSTWLWACTRQPMANWPVRQKLNRFSLVPFSYVALYSPLVTCTWCEW